MTLLRVVPAARALGTFIKAFVFDLLQSRGWKTPVVPCVVHTCVLCAQLVVAACAGEERLCACLGWGALHVGTEDRVQDGVEAGDDSSSKAAQERAGL